MAHVILIQGGEDGTEKSTGDGDTETLTYRALDSASRHDAIISTHAFRPAAYLNARGKTMVYDDISVKHIQAEVYELRVKYINQEKKKDDPQEDLPEIDFDITGQQVHVTHGLAVRAAYPVANADPDMFGGAINVEKDTKGAVKVKGTDIEVPLLGFTITTKVPKPADPFALARSLARHKGKTNKNVWYGFEPTEVLFRGARVGGKTKGKWTMQHLFAASENVIIDVPGLGPCAKRGFDYFWIYTTPRVKELRDGSKMIIPLPVYAFSHMMFHEFSFADLGLGG